MGGCSDGKATIMVLKVDLACCQCYKKVKKLLCKFPQIRDQVFDEKQNTVTITVVCCSPERIRDKLCCKAGKSIKSIEIKEPKKPEPDKPKPKPEDKPKPATVPVPVPVQAPAPAEQKPPEQIKKNGSKNGSKKESPPAPETVPKPADPAPKPADPAPKPTPAQCVPVYPPGPPPQVFPVGVCCGSCYEGIPGGPCYQGYGPGYVYTYGRPPCPPGYYAYACRCDYFCQENPAACSIM